MKEKAVLGDCGNSLSSEVPLTRVPGTRVRRAGPQAQGKYMGPWVPTWKPPQLPQPGLSRARHCPLPGCKHGWEGPPRGAGSGPLLSWSFLYSQVSGIQKAAFPNRGALFQLAWGCLPSSHRGTTTEAGLCYYYFQLCKNVNVNIHTGWK